MHPLQVAAQFGAFTWYSKTNPGVDCEDAAWFARTNWADFLPAASEGLGRLLLKIAGQPSSKSRKNTKPRTARRRAVAVA